MATRKRIPVEDGSPREERRTERSDSERGGNGLAADRVREPVEGFRVEDRRHWLRQDVEDDEPQAGPTAPGEERSMADEEPAGEPRRPTVLDEYRERAEAAERKLHEYIEAFKAQSREQEAFRQRTERGIERRVQLDFADLVRELLETVDTLELALTHVKDVPEAEPLAHGVALARDRFLATLERHGVERIDPAGRPFDPNEAEALRVDAVDSAELHDTVTETLQAGYRLGEHVIRAARVAVGRRA